MNYVIINYEHLTFDVIKNFCRTIESISMVGENTNATQEIKNNNVNVIMPNIKGLDFIKQNPNLPLVSTTLEQNKKSNIQNSTQNNLHDKYFFVKVGSSIVKVRLNEIKYIEGLKDYIKIILNDNKSLVTKSTIKHIANKLPKDLFARVHKSYVISINKIAKIEFNHIFIEQKKIPIGMQFKNSFYDIIDQYRL